jgi:hypothetical protein
LEYSYIMRKDGEEVVFDQYPADEAYEFVEMKLRNEEALPKISDFAVWNSDGDYTEDILIGNKLVILFTYMQKLKPENLVAIDELIMGIRNTDIQAVLVAASSEDDIQRLIADRGWEIEGFQGDATVIKTIMRANPGIMLLKDGTVLRKYHYRNTPTPDEVNLLY